MRMLEDMGFCCTRSGASLGVFDVIAIGPHTVRLIQVKANRWPRRAEHEAIERVRCGHGVSKEVWRWNDREPAPIIRVVR